MNEYMVVKPCYGCEHRGSCKYKSLLDTLASNLEGEFVDDMFWIDIRCYNYRSRYEQENKKEES